MKGETDELVDRVRSDAAEKVVIDVVNRCGAQPDWFFDKWHKGIGLVCAAVFENDEYAKVFGEEIGKLDSEDISLLVDDDMREDAAKHFNEEWIKAVEANDQKSRDVIEDAIEHHPDFVERVLLVEVEDEEELKAIGEEITKDVSAEVPYAVSKDGEGLLLGFACDDVEQKDKVFECLRKYNRSVVGRMEGDSATLQMAACLIAKMQMQLKIAEHMAEVEAKKADGGER